MRQLAIIVFATFFADFDTELYRPRGAVGYLSAELVAFWTCLGLRKGESPPL